MTFRDFVPPIFIHLFNEVKRKIIPKKHNPNLPKNWEEILKKNSTLKNFHHGKRCYILATGSSIKNMDLKPLNNEISMGLNEFFLHDDYKEIKPEYVVFSGFGIHNVPKEKQAAWYKSYGDTISGISTPLINICDYNYIKKNNFLSTTDVKFFKYGLKFDWIEDYGIDATKNLYECQGVGAMALQCALYMGFKEIILVGFDHDWILRMFDTKPTHFYNHDKSIIYKGLREVDPFSAQYQFDSMSKLFLNYIAIKKHADNNGILIMNATEGGMLDVFPRVDFKSLFKK
jgi:hypothetical protein